jgi:hypothetical protein
MFSIFDPDLFFSLNLNLNHTIMDPRVQQFMSMIKAKNPGENEFHQAVQRLPNRSSLY